MKINQVTTDTLQAITTKLEQAQDALWNDDGVYSQLWELSENADNQLHKLTFLALADRANQASNLVRDIQVIIAYTLENSKGASHD